jgi:hypothetical protein
MIASNIFPAFQVNNIFYQIEEQVVHIHMLKPQKNRKPMHVMDFILKIFEFEIRSKDQQLPPFSRFNVQS